MSGTVSSFDNGWEKPEILHLSFNDIYDVLQRLPTGSLPCCLKDEFYSFFNDLSSFLNENDEEEVISHLMQHLDDI